MTIHLVVDNKGVAWPMYARDEEYVIVLPPFETAYLRPADEPNLLETELETTPEDHDERIWYPISHAACPQCGSRLHYVVDDEQLILLCQGEACSFSIPVVGINGEVNCLGCGKPLAFLLKIANKKPVTQRHVWLMCSHCGCRS